MEMTNIYTLTDPRTNEVRYVGKANNLTQRYRAHLNRARKHQTHKKNWLKQLKKEGLKPIIEIIDVVPVDDWRYWERYWITQMRQWGFNLVNHTDGGDGCTFGNQTSFKKGHKSWLGKTHSEETKKKISDNNWNKGRLAFNRRKVVQMDLDDNIIKVWDSLSDAEVGTDFLKAKISACCRGKNKTHKNYKWKYYEYEN